MKVQIQRIAIVGLGSIGKRHLRLIKEIRPDIQVILVRSGQGINWPEQELAAKIVSSLPEAISIGVDAAIIASPVVYHVSQAKIFIEHEIPVLVEKPLSHTLDLAENLYKDWLEKKTLILLGYVLRYTSAASFFYKKLHNNSIGDFLSASIKCESYLPNWRPDQDYRKTVSARKELGGGVLLELSHEIDYANWFFGPFKSVSSILGNSKSLDIDVEDMADIILETYDNKPVSIHLDFCSKVPTRLCTVKTRKGQLIWNLLENNVTWADGSGEVEVWEFNEDRDDMYRNQLNHFFYCVEEKGEPKVTIEEGISVAKLIDSIQAANIRSCI